MVFANLIFLYIFLPLNIILYFVSENIIYRNIVLICFSLFFYAWGEPVWIILLIFSASIDYIHGLLVYKFKGTVKAKYIVASSLILNLGLLVVFKYSGFIVSNINILFGLNFHVPEFSLPIGISFYTFQTISYVIDVYRGDVKPQKSYLKFLLFVSLYHQLVAGPIVRYSHIAKEINDRTITVKNISDGVNRFILGLSKKVIIANVAGNFVSQYMDSDLAKLPVMGAWFGAMMFMIQIYFDFSGYSDMAIGLGKMFGFNYYENFNYPYISTSATDFWRRWHISLGSFFRDYVYIPLGGNRKHQMLNLAIVWFLTGFWHGASWNFIIWGLYFGLIITLEKLFYYNSLQKAPKFISHFYLLFITLISWVIFYFTDLNKVFSYLGVMFGLSGNAFSTITFNFDIINNLFWIIIAVAFCMPIYPKYKSIMNKTAQGQQVLGYVNIAMNAVLLIICTSMLVGQSFNPFLYFRF